MTNRKLHIGGEAPCEGWEVLNIRPGSGVDHLCDARKLSIFEENTFTEVYASHVLDYVSIAGEANDAVSEWFRVTAPGGRLYLSVLNLDTIGRIFAQSDRLSIEDRRELIALLYGRHEHEHDYRTFGINWDILTPLLTWAGFRNARKVPGFDLFDDSSLLKFQQIPLSLNVVCEKPSEES